MNHTTNNSSEPDKWADVPNVDVGSGATPPASRADRGWDNPMPLGGDENPPVFPVDALLPTPARAFVEALSRAYAMPPDVPALVWLALAGGCTTYSGFAGVDVEPGWSEQLNLFVAIALPSGTHKSAVFSSLCDPIRALESELVELAKPDVARRKSELEIKKKTLARLQNAAAGETANSEEAAQLAEKLSMESEPVLPRLLCDDVTPEKLANLLAEQGGKMILASAECDLLSVFHGRYADKAGANIGVYLKSHPGDLLLVDRIGRPSERIESPALSIAVCGQPDALATMLRDRMLRDRGLTGRFLYARPANPLGSRPIRRPSVAPDVREDYAAMMNRLLKRRFVPPIPPEWNGGGDCGGNGGTNTGFSPTRLTFTAEARAALTPLQEEIEKSMGPGGAFHHHSGWASKLPGAAARIAGILTVADDPENTIVDVQAVQAAVRIARWAMRHALLAFGAAGLDPDAEIARRLLRWMERKRSETFTRREAFQALKGGGSMIQKSADIDGALQVLIDHGHIVPQDAGERHGHGPGRNPSSLYIVNPKSFDNPRH